MRRREGWESALADAFEAAADTPFRWGDCDCCLFAADMVVAMTGVDPAASYRDRYGTARAALDLVRAEAKGIGDLISVQLADLGFERIDVAYAQRGDLIFVRCPETVRGGFDGALGVVGLDGRIALKARHGLTMYPLMRGRRAWRV